MKQKSVYARKLRNDLTDTERFLWNHLKQRQLGGLKFRRQLPIGEYIVDFVCLEKRVVIEVDGGQHFERRVADQMRDKWLSQEGFRVMRFWDHDIFQNHEGVLEEILRTCRDHPPPHPLPSREGGSSK